MHDEISRQALANISLGDVLWAVDRQLISNLEFGTYIQISDLHHELIREMKKWDPGSYDYDEILEILKTKYANSTTNWPERIFDYLFYRDSRDYVLDYTDELYRVMSIFSDLDAPISLEWVVFFWPTNPHNNEVNGDKTLYDKIATSVKRNIEYYGSI